MDIEQVIKEELWKPGIRTNGFLADRRKSLIRWMGGKCVGCGLEDEVVLEFDHIDRKSKSFLLSAVGTKWSRLLEEAKKCQLLCANCHTKKTKSELRNHI